MRSFFKKKNEKQKTRILHEQVVVATWINLPFKGAACSQPWINWWERPAEDRVGVNELYIYTHTQFSKCYKVCLLSARRNTRKTNSSLISLTYPRRTCHTALLRWANNSSRLYRWYKRCPRSFLSLNTNKKKHTVLWLCTVFVYNTNRRSVEYGKWTHKDHVNLSYTNPD